MTAATITAVAATDATARVTVTVTGAAEGELMSLYRLSGGVRTPLLGGVDTAAVSGVWVDPAPLNVACTWVAVLADATETESDPVTVSSALPVLSDPWSGTEVLVRVVEVDDTVTARARADALPIEGSPVPIVVYDVPTGTWSQLQLLTVDAEDDTQLQLIAGGGGPLLLRCSCGLHSDRWVQPVGDYTRARLVRRPAETARLHTWEECLYLAAAPRDTERAGGDTLGDLAAMFPAGTLDGIAAAWATLGAIAATDLSGGL